MKISLQIGIVLFASIALMVGGFLAFQREFELFLWDRSPPAAQIEGIISQTALPLALTSRRELLLSCSSLLSSAAVLNESELRQAKLRDRCRAIASEIATVEQANSLAWVTFARIAALQGNFTILNDALLRSYATAPNDAWLMAARFWVGELFRAELNADVLAQHEKDILLMLDSNVAIEQLVRRYLADPDFKARLIALVETLPNEKQNAFLTDVRNISRRLQRAGA